MQQQDRLLDACNHALWLYEEMMGDPFPFEVELDAPHASGFEAWVEQKGDTAIIHLTTGVYDAMASFWQDIAAHKHRLQGPLIENDTLAVEDYVRDALGWLVLHEMQHARMGHLEFAGPSGLVEIASPATLALLSRGKHSPAPIETLPADEQTQARYCIELQADDDATDLMLGIYNRDDWDAQRHSALAVISVMLLIEREDRASAQESLTHPKAATRIFQMLGHLTDLRNLHLSRLQNDADYAAAYGDHNNENDIAADSGQDLQDYLHQVIVPVFVDSLTLASILGQKPILAVMGNLAEFSRDIVLAKTEDWSGPDDFATVGAKQWAALAGYNATLLSKLGLKQNL